jgi:flagellar motor switch protein FliG
MPLTGREKATIFLSLLGAETSARILRYLPDELADLIAAGINHLPTPSPAALSEVLSEFQGFLSLPESEVAQRPRLEPRPPSLRPRKSYAFLMYERPQMVAYLLSLMDEEQKTDALLSLPREKVVIEEFLSNLRKNSLSLRLEESLKVFFKERLF